MTPTPEQLRAENTRLRTALAVLRARHADLTAAARATLAAEHDGESDPLYYVRDELTAHPTLPPHPDAPTVREDSRGRS